jgi:hypothetical protein
MNYKFACCDGETVFVYKEKDRKQRSDRMVPKSAQPSTGRVGVIILLCSLNYASIWGAFCHYAVFGLSSCT